jgi:hypothetical protein
VRSDDCCKSTLEPANNGDCEHVSFPDGLTHRIRAALRLAPSGNVDIRCGANRPALRPTAVCKALTSDECTLRLTDLSTRRVVHSLWRYDRTSSPKELRCA